ncbi:signal peptidase I [Nocardioides agariphilus]|uniref:Signal peptidase I n=1 Tax=Nocardioides agariphilus TaxID=433664 RepID=A0A930VU75_9ACTN|nr:signal peptidase I [Nocardioides agariphilus]
MTSEHPDGSVELEANKPKKQLPLWQETALLLVVALGLAILIKALLVQAFYIPSESMEPGLVRNDRILVQKVSYWFGGTPQRGDIVVFKDPGGWLGGAESVGPPNAITKVMAKIGLYPSGGHLVKRVVGVAGDTVKCCDAKGRIIVNGVSINEKGYARKGGADCFGPLRNCNWEVGPVPEGHIFVMGDNRNHSADSSAHICDDDSPTCTPGEEFVPVDLVVGKVFVLLWPRQHFTWIHRPDSFDDVPSRG